MRWYKKFDLHKYYGLLYFGSLVNWICSVFCCLLLCLLHSCCCSVLLIMVAISGAAIVLCLVVILIGCCYLKRYVAIFYDLYRVSQKLYPWGVKISFRQLWIFKQHFTHKLCVHIYMRLENLIHLTGNLIKSSCHIMCNKPNEFCIKLCICGIPDIILEPFFWTLNTEFIETHWQQNAE